MEDNGEAERMIEEAAAVISGEVRRAAVMLGMNNPVVVALGQLVARLDKQADELAALRKQVSELVEVWADGEA